MTSSRRLLGQVLLILVVMQIPLRGFAADSDAVAGARQALEDFLADWNRADLAAIEEHLSFPHVTHGAAGNLVIAQIPGDFVQDFAELRNQGWARSTFDNFAVLQQSANKVNFLVDFTRYDASDRVMSTSQAFYVVTLQDDGWGMQYRSGFATAVQLPEAELDLVELKATSALYRFFDAFNAADAEALFASHHVNQVMLAVSTFTHNQDRAGPLVNPDFAQMRAAENWSHSVPENIEAISVMPGKVIFQLEFERFNRDGEKYAIVPAVWVFTEIGGKWGIQFRSLMMPREGGLSSAAFKNPQPGSLPQ